MLFTVVLNERQRVAKRKLIEENRETRRQENFRNKMRPDQCFHEQMTPDDEELVNDIVAAYEQTAIKLNKHFAMVNQLIFIIQEIYIYIYIIIVKNMQIFPANNYLIMIEL